MENQDLYYIDRVNTWSPANQKNKDIQRYAQTLSQSLLMGDEAVERTVKNLREAVAQKNALYPRTKPVELYHNGKAVTCFTKDRQLGARYVFQFEFKKVLKVISPSQAAPPQPSPQGEGVEAPPQPSPQGEGVEEKGGEA